MPASESLAGSDATDTCFLENTEENPFRDPCLLMCGDRGRHSHMRKKETKEGGNGPEKSVFVFCGCVTQHTCSHSKQRSGSSHRFCGSGPCAWVSQRARGACPGCGPTWSSCELVQVVGRIQFFASLTVLAVDRGPLSAPRGRAGPGWAPPPWESLPLCSQSLPSLDPELSTNQISKVPVTRAGPLGCHPIGSSTALGPQLHLPNPFTATLGM